MHRVIGHHYSMNFTVYLKFSQYEKKTQYKILEEERAKASMWGTFFTWAAGPLSGGLAFLNFLLRLF